MRFTLMLFLFFNSVLLFANEFEVVFVDKDGVEWGKELPGKIYNGCLGANGERKREYCSKYIRSGRDAESYAACEKIGARLPYISEIEALIKNFETRLHPNSRRTLLTEKGWEQFKIVFGNNPRSFPAITTSASGSRDSIVFDRIGIFDSEEGSASFGFRVHEYAYRVIDTVRCVRNSSDSQYISQNLDPNFYIEERSDNSGFPGKIISIGPDGSFVTLPIGQRAIRQDKEWHFKGYSQNGVLIPDYKQDSIKYVAPRNSTSFGTHAPKDSLVLKDGSYVVRVSSTDGYGEAHNHFIKFKENGDIDRSFGKSGISFLPYFSVDKLREQFPRDLVEDSNGNIYGIMQICSGYTAPSCVMSIFKLLRDGRIDRRFGNNGFTQIYYDRGDWNNFSYRINVTSSNIIVSRTLDVMNQGSEYGDRLTHMVDPRYITLNLKGDFTSSKVWTSFSLKLDGCKLQTFEPLNNNMIFLSFCENTRSFKLIQSNFQEGRSPYSSDLVEVPTAIKNDDFIHGVKLTELNNGDIFVSYGVGNEKNVHNSYGYPFLLNEIRGFAVKKNGDLNKKWGRFYFRLSPDSSFRFLPRINLFVDNSNSAIINVRAGDDNPDYNNHELILKSKPIN